MSNKHNVENNASWEKMHARLCENIKQKITVAPDLEKLIFIGVTNRTNTGALATAIGRAPTEQPVTRHIQPIKALARRIMQEQEGIAPSTPLTFLKNEIEIGSGVQLVKETIGPNANNPAEWMPGLQLLLKAGVPARKVCFIPTFRDPFDTVASWKKMWGWDWSNFPFDSFNRSFATTLRMMKDSARMGLIVVPYIHELIRDFGSEEVLQRMLNLVGIPFDKSITQWENDADPYWQGQIIKYDMPPDAWIRGSLSVKKGGRGGLIWQPIEPQHALSVAEHQLVSAKIKPSLDIFQQATQLAKSKLGLLVR